MFAFLSKLKTKHFIWISIIFGFVVFFPTFFNGFVWDDEEQIVNNGAIQNISNLPSFFLGSTFNTGGQAGMAGLYYKPLMPTAFALINSVFGLRPFFFHCFQICLHILNSLLVFYLFKYFFIKFKQVNLLAFVLSLIFLIHPLNSETAVYLSAYQDVLFFLFGSLGLLLLINPGEILPTKIKCQNLNIFLCFFCLLMSLLGKETGILFIVVFWLFLLFWRKDKTVNYSMFMFIIIVIYSFLRFGLAKVYFTSHHIMPIMQADLPTRLQTLPKIIWYYLQNFFFPNNLAISQHWVVYQINFQDFYLPLILILSFFSGLIFFLIYLYQSKSTYTESYLFFLLWFILGLGLHSQIFPIDMTVADRWFYFPAVGLLGMLGILVLQINHWNQKIILVILSFIIVGLSAKTFIRIFNWKNGLTLYSHDIKFSQNAFDLENNLGTELFRAGQITEAQKHFARSTELSPDWWTNWNNLGVCMERAGDLATAGIYYRRAITNGRYYLAYQNLAGILIKQKKYNEAKQFLETEALPALPYNQTLRSQYLYLQQIPVK